jgi:hypothetical protein
MTKSKAYLTTTVVSILLVIAWFTQVWYLALNNESYSGDQGFVIFVLCFAEAAGIICLTTFVVDIIKKMRV